MVAEPHSQEQPPPPDGGKKPAMTCAFHPQVETRLTCTQCETPICTKCIVVCEVGMKCKKCTGKMVSHVLQLTWREYLIGLASSALCGFLWGQLISMWSLPYFYFGFIIAFGVGKIAGELIHRCVRYKMGLRISMVVLVGLLVGMGFTDVHAVYEEVLSMILPISGGSGSMGLESQQVIEALIFTISAILPFHYRK